MRIGKREIKLTNLDKVFFPERGLTRGDLALSVWRGQPMPGIENFRRRMLYAPD